MGFSCGIVGLPNVGKSTIFNALTSAKAAAANFPFCTIEPNTGAVPVPDPRLKVLGDINKSVNVVPTQITFVDIAGLIRGASKGEGLGNQFLGHIRSVDAVAHVVRCFEDGDVTHVEGGVDPLRDIEIIETELMLSDLESVEKQIQRVEKGAKSGDKEAKQTLEALKAAHELLAAGKPARNISEEYREHPVITPLLSSKPLLYVANVSEEDVAGIEKGEYTESVKKVAEHAANVQASWVAISGKVESEIIELEPEEREAFLKDIGASQSGLDKLAIAGHKLLNLITYFTSGPKETRAWTVKKGVKAPQAAGVIHSDFERGFIRAEVTSYDDYVNAGSEVRAKELGKVRTEGKEYVVEDGDVIFFRFNV